jgi:hypothetical protein
MVVCSACKLSLHKLAIGPHYLQQHLQPTISAVVSSASSDNVVGKSDTWDEDALVCCSSCRRDLPRSQMPEHICFRLEIDFRSPAKCLAPEYLFGALELDEAEQVLGLPADKASRGT